MKNLDNITNTEIKEVIDEYGYNDELDRMMQEAKTEKERDLIRQLKEAKRA